VLELSRREAGVPTDLLQGPRQLILPLFSPVILVLPLRHFVHKSRIAKDEDMGQPPTPELVSPDLISDKGDIGCRLTKPCILLRLLCGGFARGRASTPDAIGDWEEQG